MNFFGYSRRKRNYAFFSISFGAKNVRWGKNIGILNKTVQYPVQEIYEIRIQIHMFLSLGFGKMVVK